MTAVPMYFSHIDTPGKTLGLTVQRLAPGATGQFYDPSDSTFKSGLTYSQKKIALTEETAENAGTYVASIVGLSGVSGTVDPGICRFRVHDESLANRTTRAAEGAIIAGNLVRLDDFVSAKATPAQVAAQLIQVLTTALAIEELPSIPGRTPTVAQILALLYTSIRYKTTSDDSLLRFYDADGRAIFESALQSTENLFTRGAMQDVG